MTRSYREIPGSLASKLHLVMTDVDGTLTLDGECFDPAVAECVGRLQADGIAVGLVSGRDLPRLERIVSLISTEGPLIGENGGVARLTPRGPLVELGYSREPALEALAKLKLAFSGAIVELEDNRNRLVDVTISSSGVPVEELRKHVPGIQLLDSGYMVHLMPEGICKGATLRALLARIGLRTDEVIVFGDSETDVSLFDHFSNSVLVYNPRLSKEQLRAVDGTSTFASDLPVEKGFCQVAEHILAARRAAR
jgi:hydroxymethylpyrimidine pyrophosphatase-like HAD family hydrolase